MQYNCLDCYGDSRNNAGNYSNNTAQEDEDAVPVELGAGEASTWSVEAVFDNPEL